MKIFTNKNLILKIVILLVFVILFNFCAPTVSRAGFFEEVGGTLVEPLVELCIAIGDGAMNLIQNLLFGLDDSLVKVSTTSNDVFDTIAKIAVGGLAITVAILVPGIGAGIVAGVATIAAGTYASSIIKDTWLPETFYLPMYIMSPEEIFKNKIALLDVNFFNPNTYENITTETGATTDPDKVTTSTAEALQSTIANWYLALRNLALVILLSVLLYTGIQIVISSTAQDRAKYKEKLYNWTVAVCILFFMHYIMSFATTMVETISETIDNKINKPIVLELPKLDDYYIEIRQKDEKTGEMETLKVDANQFFEDQNLKNDQGAYIWPTNLMGQVRLDMQMEPEEYTEDNLLLRKLGYTVLFLILVFYTIGFLVIYIKRVIMLAFLTIIAPLVAMTYPIDKMHDGSAQAFNTWLKEYLFNLLIQPLHVLLYTILLGSAIEFAKDNIIYSIVALGFILQAEKIMRKFFGFDKASTVESGSTAAIGGALAMAGINQLRRIGSGAAKKSAENAKNDKGKGKDKIRTADKGKGINELLEGNASSGKNENNGNNGIDQERANRFKELRESGMSQEEALKTVNSELPDNRNSRDNIDYERANRFKELRNSGMSQEEALKTVNSELPDNRNSNAPQIRVRETGGNLVSPGNSKFSRGNKQNRRKIAGVARGIGAVAWKATKYAAPRVGRLAFRGGLAATGATLGIAAGLASDSDKNIAKYGAVGAGIGWGLGMGLNSATNSIAYGIEGAIEGAKTTYTTEGFGLEAEKARQNAILDKQAMKDKNRAKMYQENLGLESKEDVKEALQAAQQYREYGIPNDELIIKAMKLEGYGDELASKEKLIVAGLANEVGKDNKKIKDLQERLQEKGIPDSDIKRYIDGVRKVTKAI